MSQANNDQQYIETGAIINTHGVRGTVKVQAWSDSLDVFYDFEKLYYKKDNQYKTLTIEKIAEQKQFLLITFNEIDNLDTAMAMKNTTLYANRDDFDLEDGDYFISDIIGLEVFDANTYVSYGKLTEIINKGAQDIYVIKSDSGEYMVPVVEEFVKSVDIEKGIFITPIPGMFD